MNRFLLSAAALALMTGTALAADLPSRKAEPLLPPPPPPPMWTGFYAGLNIGYGFGTNSNAQSVGYGPAQVAAYGPGQVPLQRPASTAIVDTGVGYALSANSAQNQNGVIGGGQIGYNYQWRSNIVIGIEADIQGTGIRGGGGGGGLGAANFLSSSALVRNITMRAADTFNSNGFTSVNSGVDWLGTVRGRLGYLITPTMLVYGTGGLTYGGVYANIRNYAVENGTNFQYAQTPNSILPFIGSPQSLVMSYYGGGSKSQTLVGWNVGGGLEWMFMPNWSLKAEGIYWNMGNMNVATASLAAAANPGTSGNWGTTNAVAIGGARVNYQGVIARAGVNYHFNFDGAAPIIAKY